MDEEQQAVATEEVPAGEEGPADEGEHEPTGDFPEDVGEPAAEADTPVPYEADEDAEGPVSGAAQLHRAMAIAVEMGLVITSTTGGRHGPNSYHYRRPFRTVVIRGRRYQIGRAADVAKAGNPDALYRRYFKRIEPMRPAELFYDPMGYSIKNGRRVGWVVGGHRDHIHVAF